MADSAEQPKKYIVDRLGDVTTEMFRLVARGKQLGIAGEVIAGEVLDAL